MSLLDVVNLLPLAALAAVVGLDVVSFPQAMISRPIVAATLGGAFAGQAEAGLLTGVLLEFVALEMLPVGASRYPEWGSASVVAGALAAEFAAGTPASTPMATLLGLATALVGGASMVRLRQLNARWAQARRAALERGSYRTVVGLQLYGMTADLLRGGAVAFAALVVGRPLVAAAARVWTLGSRPAAGVVAAAVATAAVAALWKRSEAAGDARWYLAGGFVAGGIVAWLL